jgi:hypothetical protein
VFRISVGILCLFLIAGLQGCGAAQPRALEADRAFVSDEVQAGELAEDIRAYNDSPVPLSAGTTLTSLPAAEDAGSEPPGESDRPRRRLRIYTARFELLVANVQASIERLLTRVEEAGGYLEKRENAAVTVRVPAADFEEITGELRTYGRVVQENTRAEDVTKKYYALEIRIGNAEAARARLLTLLEKAEKVEDAIKIEQELRRLTEEIELLEGELKLLTEQIAFSTIEVHFRTNAPPPRAVRVRTRSRFPWVNQIGVEHVLENF